jgi:hypothetical protein
VDFPSFLFTIASTFPAQATSVCIIYAHNQARHLSWPRLEPLAVAQCEVRCQLYSGRIYGHTAATLLIASGTVFQEVLLWKPCLRAGMC